MRRSEAIVAVVRCERDGGILWLARWNDHWQAFHFVAGHKGLGETYRECLVREVAEELGLLEGTDYIAEAALPAPLEYIAFSRGAGVETHYTMELFNLELVGDDARPRIDADGNNRWLSESEIEAESTCDGQPVSATMKRILRRIGGIC
jgi:8-oxo-dGTP pyrophosphatase MutT (NUDIX family)